MGYYFPKYQPTEQDLQATKWWGTLSLNEQNALAHKHLGVLHGYITDYGLYKHQTVSGYYSTRLNLWEKEGKPTA